MDVSTENAKGRQMLENAINIRNKDIVKRFKRDFPQMSENDTLFFCLNVIGFDASAIALLTDMPSKGAVYTRKNRLKRFIEESSSPRKDDYLDGLL